MTLPAPRRIVAVAIVIAAVFLMPLGVTGTAVALPAIAIDLGPSSAGLQWAVNGFNLAFALSTVFVGSITDAVGHRRTFVLALLALGTASTLSAAASSYLALDIGRVLAGLGGGGVVVSGSALLAQLHPDEAGRRRVFALFGSAVGSGLALGPTICGLLVTGIGWRGVYGAVAIACAVLLALTAAIPRGRPAARAGRPAAAGAVLRDRRFLALVLIPLAPAVGYITMVSYLPVALAATFGWDAAQAGLFLLPMTLPVLLAPLLAARLVAGGRGIRPTAVLGASLVALILGDGGLLLLSPDISPAWLIAPLVLIGVGYGLPLGLIDSEALTVVPRTRAGFAAGVLNLVRTGGAAVAVALYGVSMVALLGRSLPSADAARVAAGATGHEDAYADAFRVLVIAMILTVGGLCALIVWLHRGTGRVTSPRRG
ncbi:MFS transporter [Microbacterium sp. RD1]|uniref:MFS transporter n=1 Tax=Microbacterium sp. RD1 TaxID=3457313 RepID=UPI003FA5CFF3